MKSKYSVLVLLKMLIPLVAFLLKINFSIGQVKNEWAGIELSEDDDYLNFRGQGTDRGYTSGFTISAYYRENKKPSFPSNLLLKISGSSDNLYGYSLSQSLWTPNNIINKDIQFNDYPYAAVALLSNLLVSADADKKQKLTTRVSIGAIGKYAFGKEVQTWFHRMIRYQEPNGWDNQVKTDLLVNYSLEFEKQLFNPCSNFEVIGSLAGNAGTYINSASVGIQLRAGLLNNYFNNPFADKIRKSNKVHFYVYAKINGVGIMDNAALQGGFFTHKNSPYVIPEDNINRAILRYEYGFALRHKRFGLSMCEKVNTPEFSGSYAQQTGNVTLCFGL